MQYVFVISEAGWDAVCTVVAGVDADQNWGMKGLEGRGEDRGMAWGEAGLWVMLLCSLQIQKAGSCPVSRLLQKSHIAISSATIWSRN